MSLFGVKGRIQTRMVDDESMLGTIVDNSENSSESIQQLNTC